MRQDLHYYDPPLKRQPQRIEGLSLLLGGLGLALIISALVLDREDGPRQVKVSGRLVLAGEPLASATVWVDGENARSRSDAMGEFTLDRVRSGNATLMVMRGPLRVGLPVKIPATETWNAGELPCFIWRPTVGEPGEMPERSGRIEVVK